MLLPSSGRVITSLNRLSKPVLVRCRTATLNEILFLLTVFGIKCRLLDFNYPPLIHSFF